MARFAVSRQITTQLGQWTQTQADSQCINFALGQPSPSLLPLRSFQEAALLKWSPTHADPLQLQYGHPAGHLGFREQLAHFLNGHRARGAREVLPEELIVTGGNSAAALTLATVLRQAKPSGPAHCVVERPTYFLIDRILNDACVSPSEIRVDEEGIVVEELESQIVEGAINPLFVYTIPRYHNPTGGTAACLPDCV